MTRIFENALKDIPDYVQERTAMSLDTVDRIQQILDRRGLSHREFAKMLGKSESEISKWMRGAHNFTFETIAKISIALGERIIEFSKDNDPASAPEYFD